MSGTERAPRMLSRVLETPVDEQDVQRVWRGIEPHLVHAPRRARARRPTVIVGVALALLFGALVLAGTPTEPTPAPFLALADGGVPIAITTAVPSTVTFADGSRIELAGDSEIVPTQNDDRALALRLTRGRARFEVTPGGPRRWQIDAGLATVEVIGTVFVVDRTGPDLHVSVERGHVRVATTEEHWDLVAGGDVWVRANVPAPLAAEPAPPVTELAVAPVLAPRAHDRSTLPHRWIALAEDGAYDRAYDALDEDPSTDDEIASAAPRELMLLADVARLSGHPAEAVAPLEHLVAHHPHAAEAPLAAVVLGRLQQDALDAPEAAARALETAEALGVPASLADDVEGRLALAYLAIGDARGVDRARHYLASHPDGRHASALRARLD